MQKSQRGVVLVEAVLAMVLLAIVVVTALGQFDDLSAETTAAVHKDVDARISSAAAINYTARVLDPAATVALQTVNECADDDYQAAFPSDYDAGYGADGSGFTCR